MKVASLILLALVSAVPSGMNDDVKATIRFHFAPQDGAKWQEIETRTITRSVGSLPAQVTKMTGTSDVTAKKTGDGWAFRSVLHDFKALRGGREEPMMPGMNGLTLVVYTNPHGKLKSVENIQKLKDAIGSGLPPLLSSIPGMLIDEGAMVE